MRWVLAALAIAVLAAPAFAEEPASQQILGLSLGQRAADPSDISGLQAAFGEDVARDMTGLMLIERPQPHYQIALKNGRQLTLWFDASQKERPIYWIQLSQSYDPPPVPSDQYNRIVQDLDDPDYKIDGRQGAPLGALLIKIDPSLPDQRKMVIKQHIDAVIASRPDPSSSDDLFIELTRRIQDRFKILGDAFRGKIVAIYTYSNVIDGTGTELIDTAIARGVLTQ